MLWAAHEFFGKKQQKTNKQQNRHIKVQTSESRDISWNAGPQQTLLQV